MPRPKPIRVISLFAGCGGLDLGFARAGYRVVFANDIDPEAVSVYRLNKALFKSPREEIHCGDIWDHLNANLPFPEAEVVKGGFPCQGFSLAGKRRLDDSRNTLYRAMKETIRRVRPKVFLAENVRGLQNIAKGEVLKQIRGELESLGYNVHTYLVDAADFGVPQHRERLFIVGNSTSADPLSLASPYVSKTRKSRYGPRTNGAAPQLDLIPEEASPRGAILYHRTVLDAIGDLSGIPLGTLPDHDTGVRYPSWYDEVIPHIGEGQRLYNFRHDKATVVHTWEIPGAHYGARVTKHERMVLEALSRNRRLQRFKLEGYVDGSPMGPGDLGKVLGWEKKKVEEALLSLESKGHVRQRIPGKYDFRHGTYNQYQRLPWDEPARTLVTNVGNPRNMLHPSEPRALSVRECARLMSFPDEFSFSAEDVTATGKYRMLGNAVPPVLAEAFATSIKDYFVD